MEINSKSRGTTEIFIQAAYGNLHGVKGAYEEEAVVSGFKNNLYANSLYASHMTSSLVP